MENSKTSLHTRTSTSASALIADSTEELIKRTGIQMLALLNIIGAIARSPAFHQVVQEIAPDAIGLFPIVRATDIGAVKPPLTLQEQIDFVKTALTATKSEKISLRAFVHLMADDLRDAHPRLSWAEIADILEKAGFAGANADSVRQALKSAPLSKGAPSGNEPPAGSTDAPPVSPPPDRPSGHDSPATPSTAVPPVAVDRAGSGPTATPDTVHGAPYTVDPGQKPDRPPVATPRMLWSARPAVPSSDRTEQRPIERDGAPGYRLNTGPDRDGPFDRAATVPPRAAEHRSPDPAQLGAAPARPLRPTADTPHPNVAPGFDRLGPAPRDATVARQIQARADRSAASGVDGHAPPQHNAEPAAARPAWPGDPRVAPVPRPPIEQPTASPQPHPTGFPVRGMPQTRPMPEDDEDDVFANPPKIPPRQV